MPIGQEDELTQMCALDLRHLIANKEVSPVEILEKSLRQLEQTEPKINAFAHVTADLAFRSARRAETAVLAGEDLGLLHGIPVSVKDLIPVAGTPCEFGSRAMLGNIAAADAPCVERLKSQGACILGKTTTSEFGCKAVGDSPLTGITRNPWNLEMTSGGSSSGAAASVAAGVTPFAVATDGGGSIRIPSSFCGTFGIKGQFGRVPMFPPSAAPTLSHIGPIARTVRDAALLLMAMSGYDRRDPFTVAEPVPDFLATCDRPVKGMRIAWSPTMGYATPTPEVIAITSEAVKQLEIAGCKIDLVDTIVTDPERIWAAEFFAGAASRLEATLISKPELLDPAVGEMLTAAFEHTVADYQLAIRARYEFREKMRQFFELYDLLATPTLPVPPFPVGSNLPPGLTSRNIVSWVYYTYPFNLTGQPAASVPAGFTKDGLPVGLQLAAKMHCEMDIFRTAAALEVLRPWQSGQPLGVASR
jgi:Asp-tRNA(Asn)/Glu-tRNA(Gln) amidotransferase A subunit family amidase